MASDYMWSEAEERIATALAPIASRVEISEVLQLLGYTRSPSAVRNMFLRREITELELQSEVAPSEYLEEILEPEEFEAAIQVLGANEDLEGIEPEDIDVQVLRETITPSQKAQATAKSRELYNKISEILSDLVSSTMDKRPKRKTHKPSPQNLGLVIHISDLHLGKLVLDEKGSPIFNAEISQSRMNLFTAEIISIIDKTEAAGDIIDEIVISISGDIPDSETVYETQPFHIEKLILDQLRLAAKVLWESLIIEIHERKPDVTICVETCRGNHGRTLGAESSNWDNVSYLNLELLAMATGLPVKVSISMDVYNTFMIKGHKGLIRHKAPKQDSTPSASDKYGGWADIHKFDFLLTGHWHSYGVGNYNGRPIFKNGSLSGTDDLSEDMAKMQKPRQIVFTLSETKCPITTWFIDLS